MAMTDRPRTTEISTLTVLSDDMKSPALEADRDPSPTMLSTPLMTSAIASVEWAISREPVLYPDAVATMEARVNAILSGHARELVWLLEHPPLYTAGAS